MDYKVLIWKSFKTPGPVKTVWRPDRVQGTFYIIQNTNAFAVHRVDLSLLTTSWQIDIRRGALDTIDYNVIIP